MHIARSPIIEGYFSPGGPPMSLRDAFTAQLKTAMLAKDAARVSTLRMITSRLKDVDISSRPTGVDKVPDDAILAMLRGMAKSRRESVALYQQGNRSEEHT